LLGNGEKLEAEKLQLQLLLARATAELGDMSISKDALAQAESTIDSLRMPSEAPSRLAAALVHVQIERHEGRRASARSKAEMLLREADHVPLNQTLEFAGLLQSSALLSDDDDRAIAAFTRAWTITAAHYGVDSPAAFAAQRYIILRDLNGPRRLDTARMVTTQEDRIKIAFGEQSLDYADVLTIQCELRGISGDHAAASDCWRQALAIYEQAPDAEQAVAIADDNIADNLVKLGKPGDALPFFVQELAARSRNFAPDNPSVIHARVQIAKTRCLTGDLDRAVREFDAAIIDYVASVGPAHPTEAVYAAQFARCLLDAGHPETARPVMERHGKLEPPRKDMTREDRAGIEEVWGRLAGSTDGA
jgi:tetratricopeptide (TPR) repeat protein